MTITSDLVRAGLVPPIFVNGVRVPPSLQINGSTLREHQDRLKPNEKLTDTEVARLYPDSQKETSNGNSTPR